MGSSRRLSPTELGSKYDLDPELVASAFESFDSWANILLAFSGKIGAGKDTTAPLSYERLGFPKDAQRIDAFGYELKAELNGLIATIGASPTIRAAATEISQSSGVSFEEAESTVRLIFDEIRAGELRSAYDRTTGSRAALQYWATEVRRAQDPLYWVKPVVKRAIAAAAEGSSTLITDVRFLTEAWGVLDAGGSIVRIDISEAEQRRRILERDGIEISEAAKSHSSETELDRFDSFTVRVRAEDHRSAPEVARASAIGVAGAISTLF